jgi:hypothetical protein
MLDRRAIPQYNTAMSNYGVTISPEEAAQAAQAAIERAREALTEVLYLSSDIDTLLKVDRALIALGDS